MTYFHFARGEPKTVLCVRLRDERETQNEFFPRRNTWVVTNAYGQYHSMFKNVYICILLYVRVRGLSQTASGEIRVDVIFVGFSFFHYLLFRSRKHVLNAAGENAQKPLEEIVATASVAVCFPWRLFSLPVRIVGRPFFTQQSREIHEYTTATLIGGRTTTGGNELHAF